MKPWLMLLVLAAACGGPSADLGPDAGACVDDASCPDGQTCSATGTCIADGTCAADVDCGSGMKCTDGMCTIGGCGGQFLDLTYVPPNVMFVLDRSCSMDRALTGTTTTKWTAAVGSLGTVLTDYASEIRWGLTMFPDVSGEACSQGGVPFPIADNSAGPIKSMLTAALAETDPNFPKGPCVTNIDTGIQQAALDPALTDPARASYLMLVSDGAQSACNLAGGDLGAEEIIRDLHVNRGIPTFIVGFGSGTDAAQLNRFAVKGGKPLAGTTKYYQADTAAQLDQAFQTIADLVVSCEYIVDPAPADLGQTWVYYEKTELVPHDPTHMAGWDFDAATKKMTMYGGYCDRLKTHVVDDIDVVFGCPVPPVL